MRYGLAQIDLNLKARLALAGLSDTPERDIAELLQSAQPIEQHTREALADALKAKSDGIALKATRQNVNKFVRSFMLHRIMLNKGRVLHSRSAQIGYDKAMDEAAAGAMSRKTAESYFTKANRADAWIARYRAKVSGDDLTDAELEIAYVYALVKKQPPESWVKPSLRHLAKFVDRLDSLADAAAGRAKR